MLQNILCRVKGDQLMNLKLMNESYSFVNFGRDGPCDLASGVPYNYTIQPSYVTIFLTFCSALCVTDGLRDPSVGVLSP